MRWAMAALGALIAASAALEVSAVRWDADRFGDDVLALVGEPALVRVTEAEPAWPGVVATVEFSPAGR